MMTDIRDMFSKLIKLFDTPMEPAQPGTGHKKRTTPLFEELC